ncbi:MAG: hypothetical protein ACHQCE_09820 [Streptosporangiales bacterium]
MWVPIVAILAAVAYLLNRLAQRGSAASARFRTGDRGRRADPARRVPGQPVTSGRAGDATLVTSRA